MASRLKKNVAIILTLSMLLSGCTGSEEINQPAEIYGCIDEAATNYDVTVTNDDGSCEYPDSDGDGVFDKDEILGCMSTEATNYNPDATDEDDCIFPPWESTYGIEWSQQNPEEDCHCSDGSNFSFWVRDADPTRLVLYFQGGGSDWFG